MPAFRVAAGDLAVSVMVAADCHVIEVVPHASDAVSQHLTTRHRIVALNNTPIKDRCELRHLLNGLHPSSVIEVEYALAFEHTKRIEIENSVECNGAPSQLAPQTPVVEEEEDDDEAPQQQQSAHYLGASNLHASPSRSPRVNGDDTHHLTAAATAADFGGVSLRGGALEDGVSGFFPTDSPRLLAFDFVNMDATVRAKEKKEIREASIRQKIYRATTKVRGGCCVIMVCISVNPMAELELLALQLNRRVISIELGVKLRLRPSPETVTRLFQEALRSGSWFVVKNAHKSINIMRHMEQMMEEIRSHHLEGLHPDARVIIFTEPHPHFPVGLTHGAVLTKVHTSFSQSSFMSMTAASMTSTTCCRLLQGGGKLNSQLDDGLPTAAVSAAAASARASAANANDWSGAQCGPRKVKMSAAVEIVDIEAREVFNSAAQFGVKSNRPVDVSGSVCLRHTFSGLIGDKFLCIASAGERGRFAVGSSLGNVYFLDSDANAMLQMHTHDSCVWDLSFYSKYEFASGSEDGTAVEWSFIEASAEHIKAALEEGAEDDALHASLGQKRSALLGSDVYCTTYLSSDAGCGAGPSSAAGLHASRSPLIAGGLANHLLLLPSNPSAQVVTIPTPSNCQVVAALPNSTQVLVGGGDGSISVVDIHDGTSGSHIVRTLNDHSRKVPSISVRDANAFFSGGFDSTIRGWDHRVGQSRSTHTLKLKNYVTGLSVDDVHLAACAGENLYMWDVRKLHEVLGGFPQAWKGLSRGIIVDSLSRQVVTASPDGVVRFWNFV